MNIYGFQKSTLLDYPGHLAATIFLGGCSFRCPFCHNGGLVLHTQELPIVPKEEVLAYLNKRTSLLEGVCITGGEPTLASELPILLQEIKAMGYQIKLDTNGTNPQMLRRLTDAKLIDYVAMDIKNSPHQYAMTCGFPNSPFFPMANVQESVQYLMNQHIPYEFRTTIVRELHTEEDMEAIGKWLAGCQAYFLQSYADSPDLIQQGYHAHSKETLSLLLAIVQKQIPHAQLRGVYEPN